MRKGMTVVDVCAGTGDMAREISSKLGNGSLVLALDFSSQMLALGRDKLSDAPAGVEFAMGRGETMPISSGGVDAACCAFALRNLESVMDGFLREVLRVLRPGGKAVLLETGRPTAPLLRWAYMFYLTRVVPLEGRLITGDAPAYR
jgi:demethylmenaquinone methyltransferase/2-methoxy-6-polyprenyl-1,4-benzoquinol methylase